MALDQAFAKKIQDHVHGGTALTQPTGLKVLLMTANGTSTSNGTELASSGSYVAGTGQSVAFSGGTAATPVASNNSGTVTYANMPAATTAAIEVWNSTVRQEFGALSTSKTTAAGDTLSFAVAAISSTLQ